MKKFVQMTLVMMIMMTTYGCGTRQSSMTEPVKSTINEEKLVDNNPWLSEIDKANKEREAVRLTVKDLGNYPGGNRIAKELLTTGAVEFDGNGFFRPDDPITRGEFVAWMFGYFNEILRPNPPRRPVVTDIAPDHKYYEIIQRLAADNHLALEEGNVFRPDDYLTREEAALLCTYYGGAKSVISDYKAKKSKYTDTLKEKYVDGDKIQPMFQTAVYDSQYEIGHALGEVRGFAPQRPITRGQAALWLIWRNQISKYYEQ